MQIGLAATAKEALVNCRRAAHECKHVANPARLVAVNAVATPPAEYKQACNFMGPLWLPTAVPENGPSPFAVVKGGGDVRLLQFHFLLQSALSVRAFVCSAVSVHFCQSSQDEILATITIFCHYRK